MMSQRRRKKKIVSQSQSESERKRQSQAHNTESRAAHKADSGWQPDNEGKTKDAHEWSSSSMKRGAQDANK
jgi:hypothetical protein